MQLRNARVCLDCEEIHDSSNCPVCASETFAFLSRWVPTEERRKALRQQAVPVPQPRSARKVMVGVGLVGGAAYVLNRWLSRAREKIEQIAERQETGDLR